MKSLVKFPIQQDKNGSNWLKINRKPTLMSVLCRDKLISHWPTLSALSNIWGGCAGSQLSPKTYPKVLPMAQLFNVQAFCLKISGRQWRGKVL
jgi:hypothetical protein